MGAKLLLGPYGDEAFETVAARPLCLEGYLEARGDISKVTIVITPIRGLITPLITTHEAHG